MICRYKNKTERTDYLAEKELCNKNIEIGYSGIIIEIDNENLKAMEGKNGA